MILNQNERVGDGPFAEMVEMARERAFAEGGHVELHRPFEMEHVDDGNCPCRPIIVRADSIEDPDGLFTQLNRIDG